MARAALEEVRIGSRDEQRFPVGAVVEAQGRAGRLLVQVVDLSLTGARVQCWSHCLVEGDWLQLDLSLAPRRASIVWAQGGLAGCEFLEPLEPLDLKIIRKALTPKPESFEPVLESIDFATFEGPEVKANPCSGEAERVVRQASAFAMALQMGMARR
jgi:hypothetical protein